MNKQEFEKYWQNNRLRLLEQNASYMNARNNYKITSGADWLLYAIPIATGIIVIDTCTITNELLKWITSAGVTILSFVVCVWIKTFYSDSSSILEIENEIKERLRKEMQDSD